MTKEDSKKPRIDTTVISGSYPRVLTILTSIEFFSFKIGLRKWIDNKLNHVGDNTYFFLYSKPICRENDYFYFVINTRYYRSEKL